jgi:glycosyltransferase involved in cell wall biosynthesis
VWVLGVKGTMLEERMRGVTPFLPVLGRADLDPVAISRAAREIKRHNAEVVVALTKKDVRLSSISAAMLGVPVVVRHANQQPLGDNLFWKTLYGRIPALHITNAEATKRTLLDSAPWLEDEKIRVIYNGVNADVYASAVPLRLDLPENAVVAGFVGSFEARKGVRELCMAWHRVAEEVPDAHLVLVGKGSRENEMRRHLGGAPRVIWLGYRTDIPSVLKTLDVLVLPSYVEGAPNVVLEAMSSGAAIVATRVSGTPELVRERLEACLVPPHDADALADAMTSVLSSSPMRERLRAAALARVRDTFTPGRMLDGYEAALSDTISAQKARKL